MSFRLHYSDRLLGPKEARIYIIEFFDYECPACRSQKLTLDALRSKYMGEVALIRYHFPPETRESALEAVIAAECAAKQGRYNEYHNILFQNQNMLAKLPWSMFARLSEVPDLAAFEKCIQTSETRVAVDRHIDIAKHIGIKGTPTLIINGDMVAGILSVPQIEDLMRPYMESNR